MNKEQELLKPRYKVIADYPGADWKVGSIIPLEFNEGDFKLHNHWHFKTEAYFQKYPHLFKKLEWWEERKIEEMPEYVRVVKNASGFGVADNCVRSVTEWRMNYNPPRADCFPILINAICLLPATESEYLAFINNQTIQS